jgi:alkylation response protein AidB-like acyl-CoA dehydrogenase
MRFPPTALTGQEEQLRVEVREFLRQEGVTGDHVPGLAMSGGHDPDFSRKLAARGWVGMAIPAAYGGWGRGAVERFVVIEELLAAGAPVSAHWVADRQTAPGILKSGTEEQRRRFLPAIARGECYFSIGMSEPEAGSDLAAVRTSATRVSGGWKLNGTKVWTSGAHVNDWFVVLCRTSPLGEDRHEGLSQLIVDLKSPGITVNPILTLDGEHHFNEVVLDDVLVPDDLLLGSPGEGWRQVTSELAYERSGPDRWLSSFELFRRFVRAHEGTGSDAVRSAIGRLTARLRTIRQLSLSVARMIDAGGAPAAEAGLVKDLGTSFEKETVRVLRELSPAELDSGSADALTMALSGTTLSAPAFTIRGGTTEILRSVAAKGLNQ